jgi:TatD DNase family protein
MRVVDTHIHLDVYPIDGIPTGIAESSDYRAWIPGTHPDDVLACIERFHDDVRVIIGASIHPWELPEDPRLLDDVVSQVERIATNSRIGFVGETGLDRLRIPPDSPSFAGACAVFERHIRLALALDLPLVVHCVRMHAATAAQVRRVAGSRLRGVVHAFAGSAEEARDWRRLGFLVGIGPMIARSPRLLALAAALPDDGWVLETDAPHMAFNGHRGEGRPDDLLDVAALLASARGVSADEVHELNATNAHAVLGRDF